MSRQIPSLLRNDIQLLRALAIISVILFHLWPNIFPNGYLGVDIFFVISGFLMISILSKTEYNFSSIKVFYFRRIKRIFPLCIFVIFVTVLIGRFLLLTTYYKSLTKEAIWAIIFGTNMKTLFKKENYFNMVDEYKFLLQTWSLSVEIQYYLIVPFIFGIINYFSNKKLTTSIIGFASFALQIFCNYSGQKSVAFNLVFCRIWQFMFGAAAFYFLPPSFSFSSSSNYILLNDEETEQQIIESHSSLKSKILQRLCILLLLGICLFPFSTESLLFLSLCATFTVTFLTFYLIFLNESESILPYYINLILVYMGNASYALYLTHWPFIVFAKYFNFTETNLILPLMFFIILVIGIVIHEIVENVIKHASNILIICAIFAFYVMVTFLCFIPKAETIKWTKNSATIEDKIAQNLQLANTPFNYSKERDEKRDEIFSKMGINSIDFCSTKTIKKNAILKKEAVILGNSYAAAQFDAIVEVLTYLSFTKVYLIWRPWCLPHGGKLNLEYSAYQCQEWIGDYFHQLLAAVKPALIIISTKLTQYRGLMKPLPSTDLIPGEFVTQELKTSILKYSKLTKKLIIISPNIEVDLKNIKINAANLSQLKSMIHFTFNSPSNIARNLQLGLPLEEFILPLNFFYEITHAPEVRVTAALKDCQNCKYFNITSIFCDNNGCPLYDPKRQLSLLRDLAHLNSVGAEKLINPFIEFLLN